MECLTVSAKGILLLLLFLFSLFFLIMKSGQKVKKPKDPLFEFFCEPSQTLKKLPPNLKFHYFFRLWRVDAQLKNQISRVFLIMKDRGWSQNSGLHCFFLIMKSRCSTQKSNFTSFSDYEEPRVTSKFTITLFSLIMKSYQKVEKSKYLLPFWIFFSDERIYSHTDMS